MKKMALIGGGSVRTYYFVESLMKFYKEMDIGELCIMDSDAAVSYTHLTLPTNSLV